MAKLRAAILGAGLISGKKHIPAFLRLQGQVELAALCDVNAEAAEKVCKNVGIPRHYTDLSELLAREKPDLIDICTPPRTHAPLAIQALRAGCNVMIEKPMAMTVDECDAIIAAAQESGAKVCVAHSDLFYYPFMKARELVAGGAIGDFRGLRIMLSTPTDYMTSRPDHWAHRLPGGVFGESGPHVVYMTLAFINPVRDVTVCARKFLDYPWSMYEDYRIDLVGDKAISSIVLAYTTNQWTATVDVLGSKGSLLLDLQSQSLVRYNRPAHNAGKIGWSAVSNSLQALWSSGAMALRYATGRMRSTHDILLQRFVESIASGSPPPVSAEEGREAVRVMNLIVNELGATASEKRACVPVG
jgi:predicted dehydrogenase